MVGVIRKRDVLAHPVATIRCFGWKVFLRAIVARRTETFLSVIVEAGFLEAARARIPEVVERAIDLELRAMRLYESLAAHFLKDLDAHPFFMSLAIHEQEHADLLRICKGAAVRTSHDTRRVQKCAEALPRLEANMAEAESAVGQPLPLDAALRLVLRIEAGEINSVFEEIVASSDASFIRAVAAFRSAVRRHLAYIRERVPALEPSLEPDCVGLLPGASRILAAQA